MPGWLSWLSIQVRLRSGSHGLWVRAPRWALCWQLRAWSLLQILCLPLSLLLPCSHSVSLSKINKDWECKLVQPLWKTVWRFLKKLKIELPYHPAIALLGIYPRDTGVLFRRDTCTPMFIAALTTIAKVWKEPKCPSMDEWIKKMWCVYIHWSITQRSKRMKSCHLQLCGWNLKVLC